MKDFLNFTNSTEISETGGNYPQVEGLTKGYDFDARSSILNITELETDKSYSPAIKDFLLSKSSKLTDFLSFNSDFFLISEKTARLVRKFKLPPNKQFNCTVKQGDKKYSYVVLFFFRDKYDYTDYKKSRFTLRYFQKEENSAAIFNSKEIFEKELKQAYQRFTDIIYCEPGSIPAFDIFKVNKYQQDYFISDRLKKEFIENNITGIDYLENVDTVFSPDSEKIILKRHKLYKDYFLNRTSFFSNGTLCRKFNPKAGIIEEFTRAGKKGRELILQNGEFKGSERIYFANGNIKFEKLVKNKVEVVYRYYFNNGILNYEMSVHGKNGIACDSVFEIDGKELKGYGLKNGNGRILHFNPGGKGGREIVFKNHQVVKENKVDRQ